MAEGASKLFFGQMNVYRLVVLLSLCLFSCQTGFAQQEGSILPIQTRTAIAKTGLAAPSARLTDLNGKIVPAVVPGKINVLVALTSLEDIDGLQHFNDVYEKWKNEVEFLFIMRSGTAQIKGTWTKNKLTLPTALQTHSEFFKQYNASAPTLVLVDAKGIVRYNGDWRIDPESLNRYIEEQLHRQPNTPESLPQLAFLPKKKISYEVVPVLLNVGDRVEKDDFRGLDGTDIPVFYQEKPTVLFLWMNYTSLAAIDEMMALAQGLKDELGDTVRVYTLNGSREDKALERIMARYHTTVPLLRGGKFLQYARTFPAVVVIDREGVVRARFLKLPTVAEVKAVLPADEKPRQS